MKTLLLSLLLLQTIVTAQINIEQIGIIPGCICTDFVADSSDTIIVSCKNGYVIQWTPPNTIDTLLAIPELVTASGEMGLLGLIYLDTTLVINYTDLSWDQQIVAVHNLTFDTLLSVYGLTNFPNHRGGDLCLWNDQIVVSIGEGLGPEGYLIALPSMDTIATGLRNPWRMHAGKDHFYITDVGGIDFEEINTLDLLLGIDYGWPCFEGDFLFTDTCGPTQLPWFAYPNGGGGAAIIGGYETSLGYVFADHYKPHLYVTDGISIDTFPGYQYLTAIENNVAVNYDGKIYAITVSPILDLKILDFYARQEGCVSLIFYHIEGEGSIYRSWDTKHWELVADVTGHGWHYDDSGPYYRLSVGDEHRIIPTHYCDLKYKAESGGIRVFSSGHASIHLVDGRSIFEGDVLPGDFISLCPGPYIFGMMGQHSLFVIF